MGRATVRAFAKEGALIGLLARDEYRLEMTRKEVESYGGKALVFPVDVANPEQIEEAAEKITKEFGSIDIWINNAMVSVFSPAMEMTPDEYKRVTEVTYLGYVYGTLSALRRMIPKNDGIIIQVGSALAYRGIPLQSAYCGAKHAIQGFTESIRCELMHEKSKVKISMVQLPALNTPQFTWVKNRLPRKPHPMSVIFQPEVAADAILWASKHYRKEWYVGLPTVFAIIGNKMASSLSDWYLSKTGFKAQQYNGPSKPNQQNNLFKPISGNFEAHGDFDNQASSKCWHLWLNQRRRFIFFGVVLLVILWLISNCSKCEIYN